MQAPSPLIVDNDLAFLETLLTDPQAASVPPRIVHSPKEAQILIANPKIIISGIFINLGLPGSLSVVRFAHQHRPATAVFLFESKDAQIEEHQLKHLPIQGMLKKPISYSDLVRKVSSAVVLFDSKEAPSANADKLDVEISAEDANFIPIRADGFTGGSKSLFDVYVRLVSGRYVKILQAGDTFSPERVSSYLGKGVIFFYLQKEAQERYLAYCDRLTNAMLGSAGEKLSLDVRASHTLNQGEETMKFLKSRGLSQTHLQYATSFIQHVSALTEKLEPGKHELLKGFLADLAAYEHGVATTMIACLMIHPLRMDGDRSSQIVGLAALLHDIGLYQMPAELHMEEREKMTPAQVQQYETHPLEGAKILKTIPRIDPAVIQAVAQHHERRNKKGFPSRIGTGHINRVAEIVGIADEFSLLVDRAKKDPSTSLLHEMETRVFGGFSNPVVEVFRNIFFSAPPGKSK